MSTASNITKNLLKIKDKNIVVDEHSYLFKMVKGQDTHCIQGTLTYVPEACEWCGVKNESFTVIKYGFKKTTVKLPDCGGYPVLPDDFNYYECFSPTLFVIEPKFVKIIKNNGGKHLIFIGKKTCPDCINNIKKIKTINDKYKKQHYNSYYYDVEDIRESDFKKEEYLNILKDLDIDSILSILVLNKNKKILLKQEDISSEK